MRRMLLAVAALLVTMTLAGYAVVGGKDEPEVEGNRSFRAADVVVRDDGRILLAGLATRGGYKSEGYGECRGEGTATRDFAVVHLSSTGRIEGDYSVTERDLESCAIHVSDTTLDAEGGLLVVGVVHEPPGLIERILGPGSSTPEQSERSYTARFAPEGPFDEEVDADQGHPSRAPYAWLRLQNGDWLVIEEDPFRERRTPDGLYMGTMSLARYRERPNDLPSYRWSFPLRALSPKADLDLEEGKGWALFSDSRRGFYAFAQYDLFSGDRELVLFRHRLDGRPDGSFGDDGRVLVAPGVAWSGEAVRDRAGDLVVVAQPGGNRSRLVVRRYDADGSLKPDFGEAAEEALGDGLGGLAAVAFQPDGKLLVAARPHAGERGPDVVLRLLQNGRLDPGFGRNGRVVIRKI
jgi:uncharacterized delta-60 repeat protein